MQWPRASGGVVQAVGYGAYRRVQAETSSPGELIVLLYDALLKNLGRGIDGIERGDSETVNLALTRAQDITLELRTSLDPNTGDLATLLTPLYDYIFRNLVDANVRKDASVVRHVLDVVTPLRDAWDHAVRHAIGTKGAARV